MSDAEPQLPAAARRRYVRQILLPEIGAAGQARLLSALALPSASGESRAAAVAADYLGRAGVAASRPALERPEDAYTTPVPSEGAVRALAGDPLLTEAAAALAGAFAAVETVKGLLAVGRGGTLDGVRLTAAGPQREGGDRG